MRSIKVYLVLWFTMLVWASAFVGIRIGLDDYSPGALALFRFIIASLCMGIIYACMSEKKRISMGHRIELIAIGVVGIGLYNITLNYGETQVDAGIASFIVGLMPVFTIVMSVVFLKETLRGIVWIGVGISVIGLVMMSIHSNAHIAINKYVLMLVVSALSGAFYNLMQKRYLLHYHPLAITSWMIWGGTLSLCVFIPALWREWVPVSHITTRMIVYLGVFPAALGYLGWCYVLQYFTASTASMYLYSMPIFSTIMGFVFLGERPSVFALCGGCIALLGAGIANESAIQFVFSRNRVEYNL